MSLGLNLKLGLSNNSGSGASAFAPTDLPTLKAWWDMSDETTITHVLGAVTQLDDKSGNGYDVTQSDAGSRPTTGTRTINSLNVLDFDGVGDKLTRSDAMGFTGNPSYTLTVLAQCDNNPPGVDDSMFQFGAVSTAGALIRHEPNSYRFDNGNQVFAAADDTVVIYTYQRTSGDGYGDGRHFRNGTEETEVSSTNPASTPNLTDTETSIGRGSFGDHDGTIGEVIFCSSVIDRTNLESYLSTKWGL